jgi:hypothetical protein
LFWNSEKTLPRGSVSRAKVVTSPTRVAGTTTVAPSCSSLAWSAATSAERMETFSVSSGLAGLS